MSTGAITCLPGRQRNPIFPILWYINNKRLSLHMQLSDIGRIILPEKEISRVISMSSIVSNMQNFQAKLGVYENEDIFSML